MPHLDEGMLHAYLDDALPDDLASHLRECAECRANLEKARQLKESADTILSDAVPVGLSMPSFEELQARAQARGVNAETPKDNTTVRRQQSFTQLRALAWAATVVLALAVGWYARSTVLHTSRERFASEGEEVGRLAAPLLEAEGTGSAISETPAQPKMGAAELYEESQDTDSRDAASGRDAQDAVGGVAITAEPSAPAETRRESAAPVSAAAEEPNQAQRATRAAPRLLSQVSTDQAEVVTTQTAGGSDEGAEVVWTSIDKADAESLLRRSVPVVEGIPVIGYAASSQNGSRIVRVFQRFDSGQLLELVITPADDADTLSESQKGVAAPYAAAGIGNDSVNTTNVLRGDLNIRLSAALTADSLRLLAQKLVSER